MINATLCTTNSKEPWAANVDFEVNGSTWAVGLSSEYAHYNNILQNKNVVVVYKTANFEMLAKGTAHLSEPNANKIAKATIGLSWLRLVENGTTSDHTDVSEIERIAISHT